MFDDITFASRDDADPLLAMLAERKRLLDLWEAARDAGAPL